MDLNDYSGTPDKHRKTARRQFEIYLEFVREHSLLKKGWNYQKMHMAELNDIWREMAKKLNDCTGPSRETSHWKKVFTEWKSHTRRKLKYGKMLTDVEKELIEVMGMCLLNDDEKLHKRRESETTPVHPKKKTVILHFPETNHINNKPRIEDSKDQLFLTPIAVPNNNNVIPYENNGVNKTHTSNKDVSIKQEIRDQVDDEYTDSVCEDMDITNGAISSGISTSNASTLESSGVSVQQHTDENDNKESCKHPANQQVAADLNNGIIKERPKQRRGARKAKTTNVSTNTSPERGHETFDKELQVNSTVNNNVGEALMAIANVLNRYCGIIERRMIF